MLLHPDYHINRTNRFVLVRTICWKLFILLYIACATAHRYVHPHTDTTTHTHTVRTFARTLCTSARTVRTTAQTDRAPSPVVMFLGTLRWWWHDRHHTPRGSRFLLWSCVHGGMRSAAGGHGWHTKGERLTIKDTRNFAAIVLLSNQIVCKRSGNFKRKERSQQQRTFQGLACAWHPRKTPRKKTKTTLQETPPQKHCHNNNGWIIAAMSIPYGSFTFHNGWLYDTYMVKLFGNFCPRLAREVLVYNLWHMY